MLNLNQLKEREDLRAQQAKLGDELAFAEEHKLHGASRAGTRITPARYPVRSMETTNSSRWWAKIFAAETFKHSRCPACIRAEQTSVKSSLRKLHVTSLLNDAGITRRFGDCEFENYLELNPEASRNLAACRRYADNWPAFWRPGKVWC
jgi:DNA replication protein DnaC